MKKRIPALIILALTISLMAFALDALYPVRAVQAVSLSDATTNAPEGMNQDVSADQTTVYLAAGLVCILFGVIAITPLLGEDPTQCEHSRV